MNKDIFLRDLRRFLADIPEEEREQAIKYYEDYFADAGPENEQKVIQELGLPIDIAKQIKSANQENISYGQGNSFTQNQAYPNVYGNTQNGYSQGYTANSGNSIPHPKEKKSWTEDSAKVALVVVLAILAIPVGIPLISTVFALLVTIAAVILSLIVVLFAVGFALAVAGVAVLAASIFSGGLANALYAIGVALVLISIGIFIFWCGILFCMKAFPALVSGIGKGCHSIASGIRSFFN